MKNNSQSCRGLRTECNPVDEAAQVGITGNFKVGVVTDCLRLNVRSEASINSDVLITIGALSEVIVDLESSTDEFYKIRTDVGEEGFCMKKYIALRR